MEMLLLLPFPFSRIRLSHGLTPPSCCCGRAADIVLDGRLQVSGGAPSAPQLQLALLNSSSAAFQQAARFYTTLVSHASAMPPPLQIEDSPFNCMPLCE